MLELYLDDHTNSKSLLGTHASTDVPGEFAWRPGALMRAAVAGTWVLIEDVDGTPFVVRTSVSTIDPFFSVCTVLKSRWSVWDVGSGRE